MPRARKRISVREAYRLRQRVKELEQKIVNMGNRVTMPGTWNEAHPLHSFTLSDRGDAAVRTAQMLGFGVVIRSEDNGRLVPMAIKVETV